NFEPGTIKAIGALELLGAVGLIVPASTSPRRSPQGAWSWPGSDQEMALIAVVSLVLKASGSGT
ncbi:DoxX family protein, partial [Nocardia sp. NPDC003263]